jgi:hypothetical protein
MAALDTDGLENRGGFVEGALFEVEPDAVDLYWALRWPSLPACLADWQSHGFQDTITDRQQRTRRPKPRLYFPSGRLSCPRHGRELDPDLGVPHAWLPGPEPVLPPLADRLAHLNLQSAIAHPQDRPGEKVGLWPQANRRRTTTSWPASRSAPTAASPRCWAPSARAGIGSPCSPALAGARPRCAAARGAAAWHRQRVPSPTSATRRTT